MKHYEVDFEIPIFHADSVEEAEEKFLTFMGRLTSHSVKMYLRKIDLLEDQPECPGYNYRCDGMWYERGKPPTQH